MQISMLILLIIIILYVILVTSSNHCLRASLRTLGNELMSLKIK